MSLRWKDTAKKIHNPHETVAAIVLCDGDSLHFGEGLRSIVGQSEPFDEIIVLDLCGNQEVKRITREYSDVRYIRLGGISPCEARNIGMGFTKSVWIVNISCDELITYNYLEEMMKKSHDFDCAMIYGERGVVGSGRSYSFDPCPDDETSIEKDAFYPCCLLRREAVESVGGWEGDDAHSAWRLWIRLQNRGWNKAFCPETYFKQWGEKMLCDKDCDVASPEYQSVMRGLDLCVVTPFSGRGWCLPHLFNSYDALDWDADKIHFVAIDNGCDVGFSKLLSDSLNDRCREYRYSPIIVRSQTRPSQDVSPSEWANSYYDRDDGRAIGAQMASLYMEAVRNIPPCCNLVLTIEDDVEIISQTPMKYLLRALTQDVASAAGVLRNRHGSCSDHPVMVFEDYTGEYQTVPDPMPKSGNMEVWGTHFGATLFRGSSWRLHAHDGHPVIARRSSVHGDGKQPWHDIASAFNFHKDGLGSVLCWDVVCKHWCSDGSYV
jgi:hypothetical protein